MRVEAPQKLCSSGLFSDGGVGKAELRAAFFAFFLNLASVQYFSSSKKFRRYVLTYTDIKKIKVEMLVLM